MAWGKGMECDEAWKNWALQLLVLADECKGLVRERMTSERPMRPNVNFHATKATFSQKTGGSVEDSLVRVVMREAERQDPVCKRRLVSLKADSGSWDEKQKAVLKQVCIWAQESPTDHA